MQEQARNSRVDMPVVSRAFTAFLWLLGGPGTLLDKFQLPDLRVMHLSSIFHLLRILGQGTEVLSRSDNHCPEQINAM